MIPDKVQPLLDKAGAAGWTATEDPDAGPVRLWTLARPGGEVAFWIYWIPGVAGGRVRLFRHRLSDGTVAALAVDLRKAPFAEQPMTRAEMREWFAFHGVENDMDRWLDEYAGRTKTEMEKMYADLYGL